MMSQPPPKPPVEELLVPSSPNLSSSTMPTTSTTRGGGESSIPLDIQLQSSVRSLTEFIKQGPKQLTDVYIIGPDKVGKTLLAAALNKAVAFIFEQVTGLKLFANFITIHDGERPVIQTLNEVVIFAVYDVCTPKSLTAAVTEFKRGGVSASGANVLVGNRIDLEYWRRVSVEDGAKAVVDANITGLQYVECSAFTGMHVDVLADIVLRCALPNLRLPEAANRISEVRSLQQQVNARLTTIGFMDGEDSSSSSDGSVEYDVDGAVGGGRGGAVAGKKATISKDKIVEHDDYVIHDEEEQRIDYEEDDVAYIEEPPIPAPAPSQWSASETLSLPTAPPPLMRNISDSSDIPLTELLPSSSSSSAAISAPLPPPPPSVPMRVYAPPPPAGPPRAPVSASVPMPAPRSSTSTAKPSLPPSGAVAAVQSTAPSPQPSKPGAIPLYPSSVLAPSAAESGLPQPKKDMKEIAEREEAVSDLKKKKKMPEAAKRRERKASARRESEEPVANIIADLDGQRGMLDEISTELDMQNEIIRPSRRMEEKEEDEDLESLEDIQMKSEQVRQDIESNLDKVLDRSDRMDKLEIESAELEDQAQSFRRRAQKQKRSMNVAAILCLPVAACANCISGMWDGVAKLYKEWSAKSLLFDNVLADTENAFQTLAKFLNYLLGSPCSEGISLCARALYGFWVDSISWVISSVVVLVSTVLLILPSFFTLLIVRTTTVEKESKNFGVRQEVIRKEKKEESFVRWVRIILRSLPMTFYLLVLPYILVYHVFPTQGEQDRIATIVCYIIGVILLQILGSVRAYYSWKSRDEAVPEAPALYYDPSLKPKDDGLVNKLMSLMSKDEPVKLKPTPRPKPPAAFDYTNPSNLMELVSLTLEFFQMATFALQNNPYESSTNNNPTSAPTMAPSVSEMASTASTAFWGPNVFEVLYIDLPSAQDMQFIIMWFAVAVVWALILLFVGQFLMELKQYGKLMARIEDSDKAKDSFFFSFTGSIVYGHGKPTNISDSLRLIVGMLSDGLFLIISFQLLQAFSCDYSGSGQATLRADSSIVCWEGRHAVVGTAALISYAFYVPLSIMISPMLLEAPPAPSKPGEPPQQNTGVSYMKLYLMFINTVKSIMLVVGVMGPETVATVVISSTASSCVLGIMTILWYQSYVPTANHYSSTPEPCNIAFINYWKAASYVAAVSSALIVVTAYSLTEDVFPASGLTTALIVSWIVIIVVFAGMYYRYHSKYDDHMDVVSELIAYPFEVRDRKERDRKTYDSDGSSWRGVLGLPYNLRHIPGFRTSPWADKRAELATKFGVAPPDDFAGDSFTGVVTSVVLETNSCSEEIEICG